MVIVEVIQEIEMIGMIDQEAEVLEEDPKDQIIGTADRGIDLEEDNRSDSKIFIF
jgi:hypothetical protein